MAAFIHVRDTLMMRDATSYLTKALQVEGIDDISSLISMREKDVMLLHSCMQETAPATDTVDQVVMTDLPLKLSQTRVLRVFLAYCNWQSNPENQLRHINDDFIAITLQDMDDFRTGPYLRTRHRPDTDPSAPNANNSAAGNVTTTAHATRTVDLNSKLSTKPRKVLKRLY
jgi:hypothetical protein